MTCYTQNGPGGVTANLEYWFEAETGLAVESQGDTVDHWINQTGSSDSAIATGSNRPTYVTSIAGLNGRNAIAFNGLQQLTQGSYTGNTNENMSFGAVYYLETPSTELDVVIQHGGRNTIGYRGSSMSDGSKIMDYIGGSLHVGSTTTPLNTWTILINTIANSGSNRLRMYKNDSLDGTFTHNIESKTGLSYIGGPGPGGGTKLNGQVAELFKFGHTLNDAERIVISNYLSAKYGKRLDALTDFFSGDNPATGNYDYDVVGIGNASGGTVAGSHLSSRFCGGLDISQNAGFEDGDYLFAGHQGNPFFVNESDIDCDTLIEARWDRTWYLDKEDTLTAIAIDLTFDFSEVGTPILPDTVERYMLIFRSGQTGSWTVVGTGDSLSGDRITFSNVQIDSDGYYTVSTLNRLGSPLPVELVDFQVTNIDNIAHLEWYTASEYRNARFDIQRSKDIASWETIGSMQGAGTTSEGSIYKFKDDSPFSGVSYYRLLAVDYDEAIEYSRIEAISIEPSFSDIRFSPNPAYDVLSVQWKNDIKWDVYLSNLTASVILHPSHVEDGSAVFNVSSLPQGIYVLIIQTDTYKLGKRIVIKP